MNESLATAGQPTEQQLQAVRNAGYEVVINLGLLDPGYCLPDESGLVKHLGMSYQHVPVRFQAPQPEDFLAFVRAMEAAQGRRTFVHCAANIRVSAPIGRYEGTVADQHHPYVRPQETGNKTDVRWLELIDESGFGLHVEGKQPLSVSAWPYALADIENASGDQRHSTDVVVRDFITLNVDLRQMGVGGDNSWGARPRPGYLIAPAPMAYAFWLIPIRPGRSWSAALPIRIGRSRLCSSTKGRTNEKSIELESSPPHGSTTMQIGR